MQAEDLPVEQIGSQVQNMQSSAKDLLQRAIEDMNGNLPQDQSLRQSLSQMRSVFQQVISAVRNAKSDRNNRFLCKECMTVHP